MCLPPTTPVIASRSGRVLALSGDDLPTVISVAMRRPGHPPGAALGGDEGTHWYSPDDSSAPMWERAADCDYRLSEVRAGVVPKAPSLKRMRWLVPYRPKGTCPLGHTAAPCPLKGGLMPPLQYGPTGGFFRGAEVLETVPGPTTSKHMYGRCAVCSAMVQCDLQGSPIRAG